MLFAGSNEANLALHDQRNTTFSIRFFSETSPVDPPPIFFGFSDMSWSLSNCSTRGGGGGLLNNVLYGEAPPRGSKWYPFHTPRAKLHPFLISQGKAKISCNHYVFPGFSIVLNQLRSHFCQNAAPFDKLRFSHHFFHFAANFVTLSYTKMTIFPTLISTVS